MLQCTKIVNFYTGLIFILDYLTTLYSFQRVFKNDRKFSILKYRIFCPKIVFFQKSESYKFQRILWATQIKKPKKKILSRSGVISILVKCLKSRKNRNISRNIEFHGLISCQIERESKVTHKKKKKKICDSPSLIYIFQVGVSAGHVIPWTGDQIFFYSPECLKQVPGTKLK